MRRISDCAVVRSTTDGHDAHVTYCDITHSNCSKDNCDFAYSNSSKDNGNFAYGNSSKDNGNFADSNSAGFSGCFCLPGRLVQARGCDGRAHQWKVVCVR